MITIRIVSHPGAAQASVQSARFGPAGGTLGRGADCTLVLDDPHRHMSRRQARIDANGGHFTITPLSPAVDVLVNGVALGVDVAAPIGPGDRLQIGDHALVVDGAAAPAASSRDAAFPGGPFPGAPFPGAPFPGTPSPAAAIPEDWDPWADPEPGGAGAGPKQGAASLFDGLDGPVASSGSAPTPGSATSASMPGSVSPDESVDLLFGLNTGLDPLAPGAPLGDPPLGAADDGRRSAGGSRGADDFGAGTWGEQGSMLSSSWRLPRAVDAAPAAGRPKPIAPTPAGPVRPPAPPAPAARRPAPARQTVDPLAAALLAGLGLDALPPGTLDPNGAPTPALMQRLGELVGASIGGLLPLLQARGTLKQAMRAQVTLVAARDNNPLKFAPDTASALAQLLAPQTVRGFLPAPAAVQEACDDLLAHQLGVMAGLRAALQGSIGRFDPAGLEARLERRTVLDGLVPNARKARLWEQFGALYGELSREAVDDFDRMFGRAFAEAYDAQIDKLRAARARPPGRG